MGNYWHGISNEQLHSAELALLRRGGLTHDQIRIQDVKIPVLAYQYRKGQDYEHLYDEAENFIHHIEIDIRDEDGTNQDQGKNLKKPTFILLHGYGAGGAIFYKMIKDLGKYFRLFVVDLYGMGSSGRPQFPLQEACQSVQEAEQFFIEALQYWIVQVGIQEKYYLAGHSFGGYIAAAYALQYPHDIEKVFLISPIGMPEKPDEYGSQHFVRNFDKMAPSLAARLIYQMWQRNYTPFHVLRWSGQLGTKRFLKSYMSTRLKKVSQQEEAQEISHYLHQIFLRPACGEYALNCILQVGAFARQPLIYRLPTFNEIENAPKVVFIYGDTDWTDPSHAMMLLQSEYQGLKNAELHIVEGSGHHLYADNPASLISKILIEAFDNRKAENYLKVKEIELNGILEGEPVDIDQIEEQLLLHQHQS
ncbi:UNKNOWN [Stylonychia lemnae]|uniref:AB hydrolase-1 domain-containing protein n=1 Tax=Stylonychia lemnae TaxID=5949 RepID=A0A078AWP0_STYLE|nr:UNKNOWN [Stylonychia lemnae]|eukprot:CDW85672.1 UNKNOWN [Stylonychia lemnae]